MTVDLHPFRPAGAEPAARGRRQGLLASAVAALCVASFAYAAHLTVANGWLGTTKAWLAWPSYTLLNLATTLATIVSAWLAKREFERTGGGWRISNAAVFIVSVVLCIAFVVSALIALVILLLGALGDSDDDSDSHFRPRRRRRRSRSQNRRRGPSSRPRSTARRRRRW